MRHLALLLLVAPPAAAPPPAHPTATGPVVELLDDAVDPFVADLTNDTPGPTGQAACDATDAFTGVEALKLTGGQRFRTIMPGWKFPIAETPAAGQFRYLRFAWRKDGGRSILVAFAVNGGAWVGRRYSAGPYDLGGSGVRVAAVAPVEWTVVTCDLFKDFGPLTLDGVLFSTVDHGTAYFDHLLLGRTVADLDAATAAALGKAKPATPVTAADEAALWADLTGTDRGRGTAAFRLFLATAADRVPYIATALAAGPKDDTPARVAALVRDLDSDVFAVREQASAGLRKIGDPALRAIQAAAADGTPEVRQRAELLIAGFGARAGYARPEQLKAARVVRVLERANTPAARRLLVSLATGDHGPDFAAEASAAIGRQK